MKKIYFASLLMLLTVASLSILANERGDDPTAHTGEFTSTEGDKVTERTAVKPDPKSDPFAWLEEPQGERALAWVRAQNEHTLGVLKADPRFSRYHASALELAQGKYRLAASNLYTGRLLDGWVHDLWRDEAHPLGLWRRTPLPSFLSADPKWDVLLDLGKLSAEEGRRWELRLPGINCLRSRPSRCLISLGDAGRVDGVYREFDLATRSFVKDGFNLPVGESNLVWKDENAVYVTTDVGDADVSRGATTQLTAVKSSRKVRLWKRGEDLAGARIVLESPHDTFSTVPVEYRDVTDERVLIVESVDIEGRMKSWFLDASGTPLLMTLPPQHGNLQLHRGHCVVQLLADWTVAGRTWPAGALVAIPLEEVTSPAPTLQVLMIPGARESISEAASTRSGVIVTSSRSVNGRMDRFDLDDGRWQRRPIDLPDHGTIRLVLSEPQSDTAVVTYQSFLQPVTLYQLDVATNKVRPLRSEAAQFDSGRFVTEQFEAVSKDGRRIPYFLVRARNLKYDGNSPALLKGYGAYQFPMYPMYSGVVGRLWLEPGGTYVLANIRGGGEFGPAWHEAAIKTNRQRAYDDFIAVAEDLIRRKITSPRRLGIEGMSAGGLLIGVMLTQRPELFRATVAKVPVLDLLRRDLLRGGGYAANEYGSPDVPQERAFLDKTSPYQNLRRRADFPMPLFMTATNDDNVHPAHARKYAAKMQELGMPFFFYEAIEGGHSASITPEHRAQNDAIQFTYLARALRD